MSNAPPELIVLWLRRQLFDWGDHGHGTKYPSAPALAGAFMNEKTVRLNLERAAALGLMEVQERPGQAPISECKSPWNEQNDAAATPETDVRGSEGGTPCGGVRGSDPEEQGATPETDVRATPETDVRRHRSQKDHGPAYQTAEEYRQRSRGFIRGGSGWVAPAGSVVVGGLCWRATALCLACGLRWREHASIVCSNVNARRVALELPPLPETRSDPAPAPAAAPHRGPTGAEAPSPERATPAPAGPLRLMKGPR